MSPLRGPLTGVRIVDLSQAHAGPFGTLIMGDLGAEVIKVEPPGGELIHGINEPAIGDHGYYYSTLHRNHKNMVLDLSSPLGRGTFEDLVKISDVVFSNYRAGVMKRQKTDYDSLSKVNPRIIRCNISGYGEEGPYAAYPAYDIIGCGMSGVLSLSGEPGGVPVRPGGLALGDVAAGLYGTIAVLAGLAHRNNTGKGLQTEVNLMDAVISMEHILMQIYLLTGKVPGLQGGRHVTVSPYGIYRTKDGFITIGPSDIPKMFELMGVGWLLDDPRFIDGNSRKKNEKEFDKYFGGALMTKTTDEWVRILRDENDVVVGPVLNLEQVANSPQVKHNNMIWEMEADGMKYRTPGCPFHFPGVTEGNPEPPAHLGQHTEEVLTNLLKYSPEQVKAVEKEAEEALPRIQARLKQVI